MEVITISSKNREARLHSPKSMLLDTTSIVPPGITRVVQKGRNQLGILGTRGDTRITAFGKLSCSGSECTVETSSIPSKESLRTIAVSHDILSSQISSIEGFIGEINVDARKSRKAPVTIMKDVHSVSITPGNKQFSVAVDGKKAAFNSFMIDPVVVSAITISPDRSSIVADLVKGASCIDGKDSMHAPRNRVLFCSDDINRSGSYKLKSYLNIEKEQFIAARAIQFASSPTRMRVSFDHSTRCRVANKEVCCRNDDDDEICY